MAQPVIIMLKLSYCLMLLRESIMGNSIGVVVETDGLKLSTQIIN